MDQDTTMGLASVSPSLLSPGAAEIVDGIIAERARLRACMVKQARMLARWAPQIFPANADGQYHFARAMMESAAFELGEAAGVPEQFARVAVPAQGLVDLLTMVERTLTALNGVHATDISLGVPGLEARMTWQVDVIAELEGVSAALKSLREPLEAVA